MQNANLRFGRGAAFVKSTTAGQARRARTKWSSVQADRGCVEDQPQKATPAQAACGPFAIAFVSVPSAAGLRHSRGPLFEKGLAGGTQLFQIGGGFGLDIAANQRFGAAGAKGDPF